MRRTEQMDKSRCAVFDLDGTLAETIGDIAASVNRTRKEYGLPEHPVGQIISYTGDGAVKLLERSFSDHPIDLEEGVRKMIRHYYAHPAENTTLYPGVSEGLSALKQAGWKLAVVTNKPGLVAREILKTLGIAEYLDDIIGGNDGFPLKPDPAVLFHLMKKYGAAPPDSWVLGDNHTDMNAASNAGMNGVYATWGYGFPADSQYKFKADSFQQFTHHLLLEK